MFIFNFIRYLKIRLLLSLILLSKVSRLNILIMLD